MSKLYVFAPALVRSFIAGLSTAAVTRDISADAGFLCDRATVFGVAIKERFQITEPNMKGTCD
jgi:hypothetical protein